MLREYETTFILQPEITDEGVKSVRERLDGILERNGAIRLLYDDDGKRRLAYEIKHFQKGHYLTLHYFDGGKAVPEVERSLRLDESVLRFLTVKVSDTVGDVEERKKQAAEEEKIRAERAAERAALDAQEARDREAEEALRLGPQQDDDSDESEDDE
ncbi:MAG TPA: 30S ribosomal protein S6 [Myxococcota bacterium]|nr:30S ribosomal protein S6 [Myxococcota bacterium]